MADADKKSQDSAQNAAGKKGKGLLKFILIPVIIAVQGAAAYFIVFNMLLQNPDKPKEKMPKGDGEAGQFYEIKDMVVNPAGVHGQRFLILEIGLEAFDLKAVEEAKSKEIRMRDALISLLTKKTPEELLDVTKRANLKKEILDTLNRKLSKAKFHSIYFNKFILQ